MQRDRRSGAIVLSSIAAAVIVAAVVFVSQIPAAPTEDAKPGSPTQIGGRYVVSGGSRDLTDAKEYETEVEIEGFHFRPSLVTGEPDHQTIIGIGNESRLKHTFTIEGVVDEVIQPGEEREIFVVLPPEGEGVWFYCRFHRQLGMRGVLGDPRGLPDAAR